MDRSRLAGVLLTAPTLRRIVRRRPTSEAAVKYAQAARKLDLEVVLFSPSGCNLGRGTIRGYVWRDGRWRRWRGPLPRAIHNRLRPLTLRSARLARRLARKLGPGLFNPVVPRSKWFVWRELARREEIRKHLPPTRLLTGGLCRSLPRLVRRQGCMVIKPTRGSFGLGLAFVEALSGRRPRFRWVPSRGRPRVVGRGTLVRLAGRARARRPHIVQVTIPFVRYRGRRCDLRVPVQRAGRGQWQVCEATVKQATRHPYLTNIARGGRAYPCRPVLEAVFGQGRALAVWAGVQRLALAVAEHLAERDPGLADLGLDIGIDAAGKPWLIEVNFRDQRLPALEAGQLDTHAQLYYHPMAYARYLLTHPGGRPAWPARAGG